MFGLRDDAGRASHGSAESFCADFQTACRVSAGVYDGVKTQVSFIVDTVYIWIEDIRSGDKR